MIYPGDQMRGLLVLKKNIKKKRFKNRVSKNTRKKSGLWVRVRVGFPKISSFRVPTRNPKKKNRK